MLALKNVVNVRLLIRTRAQSVPFIGWYAIIGVALLLS
jgi:hypothetical protein